MAYRYTTPEENEEIRQLYRTGEYSFSLLAEKYNLSKSTIINIVKRYPYGAYKQAYSKLQDEATGKLEKAIKAEEEAAQKAYERGNYSAYGNHLQRWLDLLKIKDSSYETLKIKRLEYERNGWKAFADKRYEQFGYCAETWSVLTSIIGDSAKDPWGAIVKNSGARTRCKGLRFAILEVITPDSGESKDESNGI